MTIRGIRVDDEEGRVMAPVTIARALMNNTPDGSSRP